MKPQTLCIHIGALAVLICCSTARAAEPSEYTITEIQSPAGAATWASTVNDAGQVLGLYFTSQGEPRPFTWREGRAQDVPIERGYPLGLNNAGDMVCFSGIESIPVFIRSDGTVVDLQQAFGRPLHPVALNDAGDIAGAFDTDYGVVPVVYNPASGQTRFLEGPQLSTLAGINNAGTVVGTGPEGAIIFEGTNPYSFHIGGTRDITEALAINNKGQVAGATYERDPYRPEGFLYDNGHVSRIGTLPADDSFWVSGLTDKGVVIGGSWHSSFVLEMHAVIFRGHKLTALNTLIPKDSGWVLSMPLSINKRGQIAGYGIYRGNTAAFLLTPTTPREKGRGQ